MPAGLSATAVGILLVTATAAALSCWIFVLARRRRDTPGGRVFAVFALAVAFWNGFAVLTYLAPSRTVALVFHGVSSVTALAAAFLWVEFVLAYTGHGELLTRRRRAVLWLHPAAFTVHECYQLLRPSLRVTADVRTYQGLWFVVDDIASPLGIVWSVVPFALTFVAFGLLARFVLRTRGGYRKQAAAVFAGGMAPFLAVTLFMSTGMGPAPGFDPTPMLNAVLVVVVGVALYRWDFLEVVPVATDLLFTEMSDPVFVLSSNGQVAAANRAARELTDADPEGDPIDEAVPALDAALADDAETVTLTTPAGRERVFDLNVSPLSDPYDRQRGRLVVLRDVTVQVERERELQRQNDRLDQFASMVSHDLRNPLNVAQGFAEEAQRTGDLSHLDRSLSAMDDMEQLIDDLLTMAREGQPIEETGWVDLAAIAREAWPFVDDDPTLTVESTAQVEADPDRLAELLGNLFRNARDHGPADVTVRVGTTDGGFYVADDGPGIPEADCETVFESGYTTDRGGTGLGLAIVADIADAHGWSITVEEGRTGGARFVVSGVTVRDRPAAESEAHAG